MVGASGDLVGGSFESPIISREFWGGGFIAEMLDGATEGPTLGVGGFERWEALSGLVAGLSSRAVGGDAAGGAAFGFR